MFVKIRACNMCFKLKGEQVPATGPRITIHGLSDAFEMVTLDLCADCRPKVAGPLMSIAAEDIEQGTDTGTAESLPEAPKPATETRTSTKTPTAGTTPESVAAEVAAKAK